MGNRVQGKNILVFYKVDGVYYNVFCGTGMSFRYQQELIETTNVNSGSDRDYEAGMSTATLSVSGVHILDNTESRISGNYLYQQAQRRAKGYWKITQTDDDGDGVYYEFQGLITDGGFDKNIGSYSKSDVTIQVCGPVTQTVIDPPASGDYEVYADYWNLSAGDTDINGASTGNTDGNNYTLAATDIILDVVVENQPLYAVSGTPTAGEPQYQFVTSPSVKINLPSQFNTDVTQRALVVFKRPV